MVARLRDWLRRRDLSPPQHHSVTVPVAGVLPYRASPRLVPGPLHHGTVPTGPVRRLRQRMLIHRFVGFCAAARSPLSRHHPATTTCRLYHRLPPLYLHFTLHALRSYHRIPPPYAHTHHCCLACRAAPLAGYGERARMRLRVCATGREVLRSGWFTHAAPALVPLALNVYSQRFCSSPAYLASLSQTNVVHILHLNNHSIANSARLTFSPPSPLSPAVRNMYLYQITLNVADTAELSTRIHLQTLSTGGRRAGYSRRMPPAETTLRHKTHGDTLPRRAPNIARATARMNATDSECVYAKTAYLLLHGRRAGRWRLAEQRATNVTSVRGLF